MSATHFLRIVIVLIAFSIQPCHGMIVPAANQPLNEQKVPCAQACAPTPMAVAAAQAANVTIESSESNNTQEEAFEALFAKGPKKLAFLKNAIKEQISELLSEQIIPFLTQEEITEIQAIDSTYEDIIEDRDLFETSIKIDFIVNAVKLRKKQQNPPNLLQRNSLCLADHCDSIKKACVYRACMSCYTMTIAYFINKNPDAWKLALLLGASELGKTPALYILERCWKIDWRKICSKAFCCQKCKKCTDEDNDEDDQDEDRDPSDQSPQSIGQQ